MATVVTPELPEEDWEDELTLPSGPLDWEQIVGQAITTKGGEANVGEHLVETEDGGATAWARPKANTWGQARVPVEPPSRDPDATIGETAETETPDRPPIIEPAEERDIMIEMETVKVSEHPEDMTLKVINKDAEAIQASPSTSRPNHVGALEPKGMPELEDTGPEEVLGEEPPMAVPPADGTIDLEDASPEETLGEKPPVAIPAADGMLDLEGMPELEDAGPEESMEESLADIP